MVKSDVVYQPSKTIRDHKKKKKKEKDETQSFHTLSNGWLNIYAHIYNLFYDPYLLAVPHFCSASTSSLHSILQ